MSECRALLPLYDWRCRVWLILARDMGWRARCVLLMAISGVEK